MRNLGSRLHPVTKVLCDYILCDYLTGEARNGDLVENIDVTWADKTKLIHFIPRDQIYNQALDALAPPHGAFR